jgi:hypothetical protein
MLCRQEAQPLARSQAACLPRCAAGWRHRLRACPAAAPSSGEDRTGRREQPKGSRCCPLPRRPLLQVAPRAHARRTPDPQGPHAALAGVAARHASAPTWGQAAAAGTPGPVQQGGQPPRGAAPPAAQPSLLQQQQQQQWQQRRQAAAPAAPAESNGPLALLREWQGAPSISGFQGGAEEGGAVEQQAALLAGMPPAALRRPPSGPSPPPPAAHLSAAAIGWRPGGGSPAPARPAWPHARQAQPTGHAGSGCRHPAGCRSPPAAAPGCHRSFSAAARRRPALAPAGMLAVARPLMAVPSYLVAPVSFHR